MRRHAEGQVRRRVASGVPRPLPKGTPETVARAGRPAALLIHGDKKRMPAGPLQCGGQPFHLPHRVLQELALRASRLNRITCPDAGLRYL